MRVRRYHTVKMNLIRYDLSFANFNRWRCLWMLWRFNAFASLNLKQEKENPIILMPDFVCTNFGVAWIWIIILLENICQHNPIFCRTFKENTRKNKQTFYYINRFYRNFIRVNAIIFYIKLVQWLLLDGIYNSNFIGHLNKFLFD